MRRARPSVRVPSPPRALVILNLALAGALTLVWAVPSAGAQGSDRRPGRYLLAGGAQLSGDNNAVYILDTINRELVSMVWDTSNDTLTPIGYRRIDRDVNADPGR